MIRSTGLPASAEWQCVPAGFRVVGRRTSNAVAAPTPAQGSTPWFDLCNPLFALNLLRAAGTVAAWGIGDRLRAPWPRRVIAGRLTGPAPRPRRKRRGNNRFGAIPAQSVRVYLDVCYASNP
jgi:hypothetical protein